MMNELRDAMYGLSIYDVLKVSPTDFKDGEVDALKDMASKTPPEREKRDAAFVAACACETELEQTNAQLGALHTAAMQAESQILVSAMDELVSTTSACDARGLSASWRTAHDEVKLIQEAQNLLRFKRIPAAKLRRLEAKLALCKIESVEAHIAASLSHALTVEKLIVAGIFRNDNRIALVSEETERLRSIGKEADRQVGLAESALRDERSRQLTAEQGRMATGTITRAEIASAIPAYQG
jgi:hypothetical protein